MQVYHSTNNLRIKTWTSSSPFLNETVLSIYVLFIYIYIKKNFFLEYVCTCDILKWIEKELTEKENNVYGGLENRYKWIRGIVG